jgi:lipopolysaccharide assembly protein B
MDLDFWWLLIIPVAFALGWMAARYDLKTLLSESASLPRSYFRGLNFLLNEQPDQAIDAFIEVVKLDPETIELHYALGSLFRRQGEIDRAVRIHNYLLNRADLPAAERANALAELGRDYLKGGMLDRAENAFSRLLEERQHRFEALRSLLRVYQMEREWERAIECARQLENEAGETHKVATAHFHCELAERAVSGGDLDRASAHLAAALEAHRKSVRAAILAGEVALKRGRRADAIEHWLRILADAPEYSPLVMDRLMTALDTQGRRPEAVTVLRRSLQQHPSIDLIDQGYRWIREWEGEPAAEALLREELKRHPSLLGFERLLAIHSGQDPADPELALLRGLIQGHAQKMARYRCSRCGFRSREFYWNCPGCSNWDSYPPRRIEELEVS